MSVLHFHKGFSIGGGETCIPTGKSLDCLRPYLIKEDIPKIKNHCSLQVIDTDNNWKFCRVGTEITPRLNKRTNDIICYLGPICLSGNYLKKA